VSHVTQVVCVTCHTGIVIVMLEEELDPQQAQQIMCGQADAMSSTFKVTCDV